MNASSQQAVETVYRNESRRVAMRNGPAAGLALIDALLARQASERRFLQRRLEELE